MAGADDDTYGSTSTLSTKTSTGFHVLSVTDYALTKAREAAGYGPHVSEVFTVGACSFVIIFSTHGNATDTLDWICLGLRCLRPPAAGTAASTVRASYSLLDHTGQPMRSTMRTDSDHFLSSLLRSSSAMPFMKRVRFETSSGYYLKNNTCSVRCDVEVVTCTCRPTGVPPPPPDLRRHLGELLAGGVGADVTFEVGGEVFHAHRSVLAARSPVFRAELNGGGQEEDAAATTMTNRVVRICGVEPSVFKALLHFVYTDTLPEIEDGEETVMAQRLLDAAEMFELDGLKWICEDILYGCD